MSESGRVAVFERAREADFPALRTSTDFIEAGETGWSLAVPRLEQAGLREVSDLLHQIEARAARDRDEEEKRESLRHAAAVAAGEESLTEEEQAEVNQLRIEALADQQRHEAERPQRIEALLERIARSLEGRR